jgi:hypothetical protein
MSHVEFPGTMSPCLRMFIESILGETVDCNPPAPSRSMEDFRYAAGAVAGLQTRDIKTLSAARRPTL